ncbi:MAG: EAL domain-containing protein, partial [Gemmatimonadales bacterium]|nr:EAL domain-containing protein [Gemmatimonadales bacterium]
DLGRRAAAWTDLIYLLVYLLLVASGETYWRRALPAGAAPDATFHESQPLSPLPYLAAILTYGLLLLVSLREWIDPISGVALGAAAVTVLVLARQFFAVRENVRLLREAAARQNEARFRSLVQHSSDVIFVVRTDGTVRFVSPSVSRVFGYNPTTLLDTRFTDLIHPDDHGGLHAFLQTAARLPGATPPVEWRVCRPDGTWVQAEAVGTNLLHDPEVGGIVLNARDVSERKLLEQQLTHQAFHDPLTGLANRALFRDRVSHALVLSQRHGAELAVLFLDLDDFKKINDSLGHTEGDRLLAAVAKRLRACARESDTVARLGGDEFAVLIEGTDADGRTAVVVRVAAALAEPLMLGGGEVYVRASTGLATATGGETADDLLRNADVAMYSAKRDGKGRHAMFDPRMYEDLLRRMETEDALRRAIDGGELSVAYQPIVTLETGLLVGVEALVRWDHPRLGRLAPQHFIALAEETGLIVSLEEWVLREAARQLRSWREIWPGAPIVMTVNVSGRHLMEPDVVSKIRGAVSEAGVDPNALVLEITESVLMQQTDGVLAKLRAIRDFGIRLAIDDFGTGYSSLSYLQRFPIDILKIAKPFVDEVTGGVEQSALARAIIGLGATLRLQTLAEGIEREDQRSTLLNLGCELGQGYHFARPLPPAEIERFLQSPTVPVAPFVLAQDGVPALPSVSGPLRNQDPATT